MAMLHVVRRNPSAVLLFVQLGGVLVYQVVQAVQPERFIAADAPCDARTWMLYLSFTTLTSTGLSDVVPVKAFARARW